MVNPSGDPDLSQLSVLAEFLFLAIPKTALGIKVSSVPGQRYQCSLRTLLLVRKRLQEMWILRWSLAGLQDAESAGATVLWRISWADQLGGSGGSGSYSESFTTCVILFVFVTCSASSNRNRKGSTLSASARHLPTLWDHGSWAPAET